MQVCYKNNKSFLLKYNKLHAILIQKYCAFKKVQNQKFWRLL
ncbi:hypothetical protein HMPREF0373_01555 [Eubacterium ramulus ATCC 29099]|uniref:Uncharacterized protein n=1 Tax=Eubacterium ramulus ATCC 29099 TaxID=1256908 RepID=U2R8K5_EUBRA|nr:hypothetical protein HMPREF0373_01555 [Eubacterium ramulus ATCC 29099]